MSITDNLSTEDLIVFKNWLGQLLQAETVTVEFTKSDGSNRVMRCTLKPEHLPTQSLTESRKIPNHDVCVVWDIEAKGWRSFRWNSVTRVQFKFEE